MALPDALGPLRWAALRPLRLYFRASPFGRGKGFLVRHLVLPLLPRGTETFAATLPGGGVVDLRYREALGLAVLLEGAFEPFELEFVRANVRAGTCAIDVGANVGLFSVAMARAAPAARVIAIEPVPDNFARLQEHLRKNGLENVEAFQLAAGDARGPIELLVPIDAAYTSQGTPKAEGGRGERALTVNAIPLDDLWRQAGSPEVSLIKADVEGAEAAVVRGAMALLDAHRPVLLLEANTGADLERLRGILSPLGYRDWRPAGFAPWNHVFTAQSGRVR